MDTIGRVFRISLYLLAVLSTLLLGMGERLWLNTALMALAAIGGFVLTEREPKWTMPTALANGLAVVAVLIALVEIVRGGPEYQLLGLAHLLVYLQVIVLFQAKNFTKYWQIIALGLFQVTVAGVMNLDIAFGLLLLVYVFLGLWVLALFHLYRERQTESLLVGSAEAHPSRQSRHTGMRRLVVSHLTPAVGLLGLFCLATVAVLFPLVPRVPSDAMAGPTIFSQDSRRVQSLTGLGESVRLGQIGRILESDERVMRVAFVDLETGEPYRPPGEPLFRGMVLTQYTNGSWTNRNALSENTTLSPKSGNIREEFDLEPLGLSVLFATPPISDAVLADIREPLRRDEDSQVLLRPEHLTGRAVRYEVYSSRVDLERGIDPNLTSFDDMTRQQQDVLLQLPSRGLEDLQRLAGEIVASIPVDESAARARAIEQYLGASGRFTYSLDPQVTDPDRDPVEDFLVNHRTGHCEYFASAMALMLRAVDIPARVVSGFKGGAYNQPGGYYTVLQRHAHLWVETFVADPPEPGHWLPMDPTPGGARLAEIEAIYPESSVLRQWFNYGQRLWSRNIVGFQAENQLQFLGGMIASEPAGFFGQLLGGGGGSRSVLGGFGQIEQLRPWAYFATFILLVLFFAAGAWLLRWAGRLSLRVVRSARPKLRGVARGSTSTVDFYRRLEEVLARHRLVRAAAVTPGEFARDVSRRLSQRVETESASVLPGRVVDAFYRVRFGHETIDAESRHNLLAAVDALDRCFDMFGTDFETKTSGNGRRTSLTLQDESDGNR